MTASATAAPARLYPLRQHPVQERVKRSKARFKVIPAGRRSGKTELAKRNLIVEALSCHGYTDANFFAAAPTRDQAKAIYWTDLKAMIPRSVLAESPRESELSIRLITGTTIFVVGMDKPERIEGRPWNGGVLDEFANMKAGAWGENVRPALSDRKGWCWLIGVPEGRNHYYDINQQALDPKFEDWESFTWKSVDILDPKEVEAARQQLDPLVFAQEYEASFVNFVGRAYYTFIESDHCRPLKYDPSKPLIFCFDFNVDPGVAVICQEQRLPGQYWRDANGVQLLDQPIYGTGAIGEVWIPKNSNTPAVCRKLVKDWGTHVGPVLCYGDSTGGNRGTAKLDGSDWDLIKAGLRPTFRDRLEFHVGKSNPAERARVNAMNSRIRAGDTTKPIIRFMVDRERCPQLVKDLEGTRLLEGGSGEIDKKVDRTMTHLTDAVGYYVEREFPTTTREAVVTEQRY